MLQKAGQNMSWRLLELLTALLLMYERWPTSATILVSTLQENTRGWPSAELNAISICGHPRSIP